MTLRSRVREAVEQAGRINHATRKLEYAKLEAESAFKELLEVDQDTAAIVEHAVANLTDALERTMRL